MVNSALIPLSVPFVFNKYGRLLSILFQVSLDNSSLVIIELLSCVVEANVLIVCLFTPSILIPVVIVLPPPIVILTGADTTPLEEV